jgi:tetratricopeptide (TPR) repeat protein
MSRIVRIASWKGTPRASVVFVHGLGGHVYDTWRRAPDDDTFWPLWLARDVEGLAVYSLAYEAPASNWLGTSMPLQDRAVNIFELLLTEPGLRSGPVVFVCHSLGGLIVKKILLNLQQQAMRRPEAADFLQRVTEIVFAATPHTGSAQATWLDRLRFLAWPSSVARVLVANDPALRDINVAYRGLADEQRNSLRHQIFYETLGTPAGEIVDEASADPGLPGDPPVPVDADHISIVKPRDRSSLLYARARQFVELVPAVAESGNIDVFPLPIVRSDQPLNIAPKLIRIAALCLVALIAFKGVQALITPPLDVRAIQAPYVEQLAEKDRQLRQKEQENKELAARFASQRTTPALPGADQQLEESLVSVGNDADPRSAQAIELIKADKLSEAELLLKAVAEDKEKSTVNLSKDAAAAYRNAAAITGVFNPGGAREYYAKAAQLDPDNVDGVIWNGWYQFLAGKLDAAQAAFERVISIASPSDSHWVFWARTVLGDILLQRDDLPGALRSYRNGLAVIEDLAKSNPGDTGWQRDLSVSYQRIGDVQMAQNDLPAALKSYQDGLAIVEKLANSEPANADAQRDLALFLTKTGDIRMAQNDLPGALKSYRELLAIADRLAKSNPGNALWQRDVSASFERIGIVQVKQNDLPGALKSYRDGFVIVDRLAKSDPGNRSGQRDLSLFFEKTGDVQKAQADLPGALKSYRDGLAIADQLAKSDTRNTFWQGDLSRTLDKIGDVQLALDDLPGALKSYSDRVTVAERMTKSDPGNTRWQSDLAMSFIKIGDALITQGNIPGALESYGKSFPAMDELAKSDPAAAERLHGMAMIFFKKAAVLKQQNRGAMALQVSRQGRDVMARLVKRSPENTAWKRDLDLFDKQISGFAR